MLYQFVMLHQFALNGSQLSALILAIANPVNNLSIIWQIFNSTSLIILQYIIV